MKVQKGFTLVELMIVVVVIAILSTFALGNYSNSVRKAQLTDGRGAILDILQQQERLRTMDGSYTLDLTEVGLTADGDQFLSPDKHFVLQTGSCSGSAPLTSCVKVLASPVNAKAGLPDLSADTLGARTPADSW